MKQLSKFSYYILLSITTLSISFGDVTSSITSLVGRNAEGYLAPLGTMMGTGMNSGFYRKASPHKILGFDITLDFAYAMAPSGQTTYNFVIPNDSISFPFQFQFPKSLLTSDLEILSAIPTAGTNDIGEELYQDQTITFGLAVSDMLDAPSEPAQNILGTDESTVLKVTLDNAVPQIFDQVVENTWSIAQNIPGLGTEYPVTYTDDATGLEVTTTIDPLYSGVDEFKAEYGDPMNELIRSGLGEMEMPELPIPGGFGNLFDALPLNVGFPTPIFQASIGLPFSTEITFRGIPMSIPVPSIGEIKYGGTGGKIGISNYLGKFLYAEENLDIVLDSSIVYVIQNSSEIITPLDVDNALSTLDSNSINLAYMDSLSYQYLQGDTLALVEIQNQLFDLNKTIKKKNKKKKKFPIDVSVGYYKNDLDLDFSGAKLTSTNSMLSLQLGKTLNLPSFLSFIGGVGIYGGFGIENSDLNISYELANPLSYGCFSSSDEYREGVEEESCSGSSEWRSGVPQTIALGFPGDNKFRSLIGMRARILFVDAYVDYNLGTSNALNAGFGITFR